MYQDRKVEFFNIETATALRVPIIFHIDAYPWLWEIKGRQFGTIFDIFFLNAMRNEKNL